MKTFLKWVILCAIALCVTICTGAKAQTNKIQVLAKNEAFIATQNNTLVMDKYTFAKYHYAARQCDTLKKQVQVFDNLIAQKDSTIDFIQVEFNELWLKNQDQLRELNTAYQNLQTQSQQAINLNKQLQTDYKKLEIKNKRAKRWRNFYLGTAAISTSLLVLLVTH